MMQPRLEVAEVFREFAPAFLHKYGETLSPDQRRVLCNEGRLIVIEKIERQRSHSAIQAVGMSPWTTDTS
jgi:hypothetical protein